MWCKRGSAPGVEISEQPVGPDVLDAGDVGEAGWGRWLGVGLSDVAGCLVVFGTHDGALSAAWGN